MKNGIWINETQFISFAEMQRKFTGIFAGRENAAHFFSTAFKILPDPDLILRKQGNLVETFNKMENDPHIWAEMQKRKALTTSLTFSLVRGRASEKYVQLWEDYLLSNDHELFDELKSKDYDDENDSDVYDLIATGLNAVFHGYQPVEIIWEKVGNNFFPVKLIDRPREWFHFDVNNKLRFKSKGSPFEGELTPPKKFLLFRHEDTYDNPYGKRVLSKCFWAWMFKHSTEKWKIQFLEKFGSVWAVGKLPRGKEDPEYSKMLDALEDLINSGVAVIPSDGSIEIVDPAGKGTTSKIFDDNVNLYNQEMSKAILTVTSLTGSEGKGSYASDQVRERMVRALAAADKKDPVKRINRLTNWVFDVNGYGIAPMAELLEPEDYDIERAKRDFELHKQGVRFNKKYYTSNYGYEEDDIEIKAEDTAPPLLYKERDGVRFNFSEPDSNQLKTLLNSIPSTQLQKLIEPVIKPVLDVFKDQSISFEEAMEKVTEILPGVNTDELEEFITKLSFISFMAGASDADK